MKLIKSLPHLSLFKFTIKSASQNCHCTPNYNEIRCLKTTLTESWSATCFNFRRPTRSMKFDISTGKRVINKNSVMNVRHYYKCIETDVSWVFSCCGKGWWFQQRISGVTSARQFSFNPIISIKAFFHTAHSTLLPLSPPSPPAATFFNPREKLKFEKCYMSWLIITQPFVPILQFEAKNENFTFWQQKFLQLVALWNFNFLFSFAVLRL